MCPFFLENEKMSTFFLENEKMAFILSGGDAALFHKIWPDATKNFYLIQ